ncbi:MAG: DUF4831 family protein, partial [Rikenella sp.]|nr:DUF4831 family protein [Rikenella sp.]
MKRTTVYSGAAMFGAVGAAGLCGAAQAQVSAFPQGGVARAIDGYTLPRTVVDVTLVVEREVILRGPYAKFAAQYLGISGAAMSDKQNYRIIDAALGYSEEPDPTQTYHLDRPVEAGSRAFHWLSVDPAPRPLRPAGALQ